MALNPQTLQVIEKNVYELFPSEVRSREEAYRLRQWIFPNHFDIMRKIANDLCEKYGGEADICTAAVLLHDTGLVYKRESSGAEEHESRSVEYARKLLAQLEVEAAETDAVIECIEATEVEVEPASVNAKIVRSADALSQFMSIHFFAKAHFYPRWDWFMDFFERKVKKAFDKVCFEEEREAIKPIRDHYENILKQHQASENYPPLRFEKIDAQP